jgi:DNA topoisomerase-1
VAAIQETARMLGNTPAICRTSYIYPAVVRQSERGHVTDRCFRDVGELVRGCSLHASERALLQMLKRAS